MAYYSKLYIEVVLRKDSIKLTYNRKICNARYKRYFVISHKFIWVFRKMTLQKNEKSIKYV